MSNLNRILKKLTAKPSIIDKTNDIIGFSLTNSDRKNLSILLKRQYVEFSKNITDNDLLRLYLNTQYTFENHKFKMEQRLKKEELDNKQKINKMLDILSKSEVKTKKSKPTKMSINQSNHFVKLVK